MLQRDLELPFLIDTAPRLGRNLLKFRYGMLDKARERAREVNQKGALFAWRTINGEEASAYYAAVTHSLLRGNEITIHHDNDEIRVTPAEPVTVPTDVAVLREE